MIGEADLLGPAPTIRAVPPVARMRRAAALALVITSVVATAMAGRAIVWIDPPVASAATTTAPVSTTTIPSEVLSRAIDSPWVLIDLSLRSDPTGGVLSARFAAPRGSPALPERLLLSLAGGGVRDVVPVAMVATSDGTAVDVRAVVDIDRGPRPDRGPDDRLPALRVADLIEGKGARPLDIRTVPIEGGQEALAVSLVGSPASVVAVVLALEHGPTSPARIGVLRARPHEGAPADAILVELVMSIRPPGPDRTGASRGGPM